MAEDAAKPPISPTAIPLADAARLLSKVGGQPVSVEMLETDVECGAPVNPDGTLNILHYAAWLVRELANDQWPLTPANLVPRRSAGCLIRRE